MKYVLVQGDGMPDHPVSALGGKTPLEAARKPNLDRIAREGRLGLVETIPSGLPPGSDVGNLSLMGYDPNVYYTGRSPLEAAAMGVKLGLNDYSFRMNLVTLSGDKGEEKMEDYSAGHITTDEAKAIVKDIARFMGAEDLEYYPGVSYRHLMVWRRCGLDLEDDFLLTPPHDLSGRPVAGHLPKGAGGDRLLRLMATSQRLLKYHPVNRAREGRGEHPANSAWFWGQGKAPNLPPFETLHRLRGAVISAVDLVRGVGACAGLEILQVPGITGYFDTDYGAKARAALEALERMDFVFVHVEAPDEAGHEGKVEEKVRAIESIDEKILGVLLAPGGLDRFGEYRILVVSDHPTPLDQRTHVSEPVPFAVYPPPGGKGSGRPFAERTAEEGGDRIEDGFDLLRQFLGESPRGKGGRP